MIDATQSLEDACNKATANNLVKRYVKEEWNKYLKPLNKNPVKFDLITRLNSRRPIQIPYSDMRDILGDLVNNSMSAISRTIDLSGEEIMEIFEPYEAPGKIVLRTKDVGDLTLVEIEDDGYGIDPKKICDRAKHLLDKEMAPSDIIDYIFTERFSTKGSPGLGLSDSRAKVEKVGGRIYIAGTTYIKDGKFFADSWRDYITVGEHPGKATGTIIRMEFPSKHKK